MDFQSLSTQCLMPIVTMHSNKPNIPKNNLNCVMNLQYKSWENWIAVSIDINTFVCFVNWLDKLILGRNENYQSVFVAKNEAIASQVSRTPVMLGCDEQKR